MFPGIGTLITEIVAVAILAVMAIRLETAVAQCIRIAIGAGMRKYLKTDGAERNLHTENI